MKTSRYLLTLMLCSAGTSLAQSEAFQAMMTEAFTPLTFMISGVEEKVGKLKCGAPDLKMGGDPENAAVILNQLARSKSWSLLTKAEVVGGTGYLYQTQTKTQFVFASISVSGYIAYESCDASDLTKPQVTPAKPPTPQRSGANPQAETVKPPPPPGVLYDPTYYVDGHYKDSSIERRLLELAKRAKRQNIFPRHGQVNISPEVFKQPCDLSNTDSD